MFVVHRKFRNSIAIFAWLAMKIDPNFHIAIPFTKNLINNNKPPTLYNLRVRKRAHTVCVATHQQHQIFSRNIVYILILPIKIPAHSRRCSTLRNLIFRFSTAHRNSQSKSNMSEIHKRKCTSNYILHKGPLSQCGVGERIANGYAEPTAVAAAAAITKKSILSIY